MSACQLRDPITSFARTVSTPSCLQQARIRPNLTRPNFIPAIAARQHVDDSTRSSAVLANQIAAPMSTKGE